METLHWWNFSLLSLTLDILPEEFDSPLYWKDEDLQLIAGYPLYKEVIELKDNLQKTHAHFLLLYQVSLQFTFSLIHQQYSELFPIESRTIENLLWAYSVIWYAFFFFDIV